MALSIVRRFALAVAFVALAVALSGCLGDVAPHLKQLPAEAQALLAKKGMRQEAPIFIRIFKEESELEVWKQKDDGRYYHFKTYPICNWSGSLGPKIKQGDKQAPEGFYTVRPGQLNPKSEFHLAFNLGYPNAYDRANGHTGKHLMVHGDCRSAGCYAMTDALIEEIYILAREAFQGGQKAFHVHAFPFRMTEANLARHRKSRWYSFWRSLKEGYDAFEATQVPPQVAVCSKQYLVNAEFMGHIATPDPQGPCPPFKKLDPQTAAARILGSPVKTAGAGSAIGGQTPVPRPVLASAAHRPTGTSVSTERSAAGAQPVTKEDAKETAAQEGTAAPASQPWIVPASMQASAAHADAPPEGGAPAQDQHAEVGYSSAMRSMLDHIVAGPSKPSE